MNKLTGQCECEPEDRFEWSDGLKQWESCDDWWPLGLLPRFCDRCGSRLNADGTADAGSAAWGAYDATRTTRMAEGGVPMEVVN